VGNEARQTFGRPIGAASVQRSATAPALEFGIAESFVRHCIPLFDSVAAANKPCGITLSVESLRQESYYGINHDFR